MNVIPLLVFCSLGLVVCSVVLFLYSVRHGDHDHADRLALLPLEDDSAAPAEPTVDVKEPPDSSVEDPTSVSSKA